MMKRSYIHPFLFGVFPILFLYSHNVGRATFSDVLLPLAVTVSVTAILMVGLGMVLKSWSRAGVIVSIFWVMFFSYGHAFDAVQGWRIGKIALSQHVYLMLVWCEVLASWVYYFVRMRKDVGPVTQVANVVAISLVVMTVGNVGVYQLTGGRAELGGQEEIGGSASVMDEVVGEERRDIYYIILDGYASASTLEEIYSYDNGKFIEALRERGFYVASESLSNYPTTYHSLASSLNMAYLNYLAEEVGEEATGFGALSGLIEDNEVVEFLKAEGYRFVYFSSGWGPTEGNEDADLTGVDLNVQCGDWWGGMWDEFTTMLIQTTMLRPLDRYFVGGTQVLCAFAGLGAVHEIEGPTFAFAHIISPHPPFLFGANGEPVPDAVLKLDGFVWEEKEHYVNQLKFVNKKVEALVDEILAGSEVAPIIVLQADHGSACTFGSTKDNPRWTQATDVMLRERMRIFNAYYLPGGGDEVLYESITPINTFRLIFNYYFGAEYELLEDRSYHVTQDRPYLFTDVTEKVRYRE